MPHLRDALTRFGYRLRYRSEAERAAAYWGSLREYHKTNDADPAAQARSRWLAELVPSLGITSLLEVGCNTARNLAAIHKAQPGIRVAGIDVNRRALDYARARYPDIELREQDANQWREPPNSWDAILTMSVLDHIPADALRTLIEHMAATATDYLICVEFWDGSEGERALYKYSHDLPRRFEAVGVETLRWESSVGQYDPETTPLYTYIGKPP